MDGQGLKISEADIRECVEGVLRSLSIPNSIRVRLCFDLADGKVRLDREAIQRAFGELVKNALDAMPAGGELAILLSGDGDRIELAVEDTGVGITPEDMAMLFTPFFTTKPVGEGAGLGLPSVYGTVKAHGGGVTVESNADPQRGATGTTVRITLPRWTLVKDPKTSLILHDD
ncbi:MAG: HAMP domain-containing histidine kinase [Deltaproteobacteria bacterium]|nr:HAMP domain-containing histidine kinase [Deltaproteobacteria bacterium]